MDRPSFDEYFMLIAVDVALRSEDPNIKHGSVIVNHLNHIIGTGYNAAIRGINTKKDIPLFHIRDEKRKWMIHSEENAILNCTSHPSQHKSCTLYVTGIPCVNCLQRVINFGITQIVYLEKTGTSTDNQDTQRIRELILKTTKIEYKPFPLNNKWIKDKISQLEERNYHESARTILQ